MPHTLDRPALDAMRDGLLVGNIAPLAAPFLKHGLKPPTAIWNPMPDDLPTMQLPFVLNH